MAEEKNEIAAVEAEPEKESKVEAGLQEPKVETFRKRITAHDLSFLPDVRKDLPVIRTGDLVKVSYRVIEGGKERLQGFEGTVIAQKNTGISRTITVRKTSFGIAIERIFPLNSKLVQIIEVKKHTRVRRAKLYFLRNLKGKAARLKELR